MANMVNMGEHCALWRLLGLRLLLLVAGLSPRSVSPSLSSSYSHLVSSCLVSSRYAADTIRLLRRLQATIQRYSDTQDITTGCPGRIVPCCAQASRPTPAVRRCVLRPCPLPSRALGLARPARSQRLYKWSHTSSVANGSRST